MGLVSRAKKDDPAGCEDLPRRLKSESNVVFTSREKLSEGFLLGNVFHKSCLISNRTISADDSTAGARLFDGKAGLIRANNSGGWDLRKGPSDRENQDVQYRRARTSDRGATRTTATVRHEREQGDERFLTHAQHELRTVAAYGRMPDGGERENSTWSARAEGRRDETRIRLGASETVIERNGMRESTA
ncbi:hypothetical protein ALC57_16546 [Trachymyrmex cornetzi]|uniref:Uncharacterized protein n=1 Tax=Trachymyrmex cornetzi TaxID=471704 RepID=A0A195DEK5_9HYME|nr:hypothetical protein ALC57_16546 [Trachymyrmex cornetzi]